MAATVTSIELVLHSAEANWDRERWDELPNDGNRYEIIDGVLYLSTAPSLFHQWISGQLQRLFYRQIDERGLGLTFDAPVGLFMPGCDLVQPDVMVLRIADQALILEQRAETIPLLLVEILSPSNSQHDLSTKRQAYARAGVPEYWVIRPQERDLLLHSEPEPTSGQFLRVQRVALDEELVSVTLPIRTPLAALFALPEAPPRA